MRRLALLLALLPGCAAFASLDEPRRPFGGVRFHAAALIGQAETHCADWRIPQGPFYVLLAPFTLPGLACCAVLDLLVLPTFLVPEHDVAEPLPVRHPRPGVIVAWAPTEKDPMPPPAPAGVVVLPCKACGYPQWSGWADCPRCATPQEPEWPPAEPGRR